ncbi:MAG: hypothetical protein M0P02_04730 [Sulfurospirillaceae bacterium]|nr:hypothetical protein [Sulfurospirillaceae bacterium]MCK9545918.1 hypothetical protein [Sulfurospirillaceae bacterium]NLM99929.1 hypothetical protein [Campylobacteraceae bacterium]
MRLLLSFLLFFSTLFSCEYKTLSNQITENNQLIWAFVVSKNCKWCNKMSSEMIDKGFYRRHLKKSYFLSVLTPNEAKKCGIKSEFYPNSFLIDPSSMKIIGSVGGYKKPREFIEYLNEIYVDFFKNR